MAETQPTAKTPQMSDAERAQREEAARNLTPVLTPEQLQERDAAEARDPALRTQREARERARREARRNPRAQAQGRLGETDFEVDQVEDLVEISQAQQYMKCALLATENVPNSVKAALDAWGAGCSEMTGPTGEELARQRELAAKNR